MKSDFLSRRLLSFSVDFPFGAADEAINQHLSSACSSGSKSNQTQSLAVKISPTFSRMTLYSKKHAAQSPFPWGPVGVKCLFSPWSLPILFWSLVSSCHVSLLCDWFACSSVFHLCSCVCPPRLHAVFPFPSLLDGLVLIPSTPSVSQEVFDLFPLLQPLSLIICRPGSLIWTLCLCFQASEPDTLV